MQDKYWIEERKVWVYKNGIVLNDRFHLISIPDKSQYKLQIRYKICSALGGVQDAMAIVKWLLGMFPRLQYGLQDTGREYINKIDSSYFRYLDDAELACNNLNHCIRYLRENKESFDKKSQRKIESLRDLLNIFPCTEEQEKMRALSLTLKGKRRAELTESLKELSIARDIVSRERR